MLPTSITVTSVTQNFRTRNSLMVCPTCQGQVEPSNFVCKLCTFTPFCWNVTCKACKPTINRKSFECKRCRPAIDEFFENQTFGKAERLFTPDWCACLLKYLQSTGEQQHQEELWKEVPSSDVWILLTSNPSYFYNNY
jgi:hypothetical protein